MHARISASAAKNVASRASIRSRTSDISTFCSIVAIPVTNPPGSGLGDDGADRWCEPGDIAGPSHCNGGAGDRIDRLLQRQICHAAVRRSQIPIARIGDDADDLELILDALAREIHLPAERTRATEECP